MEHDVGFWFPVLSLFFPRLVLFLWWLTGNLPYNTTPFFADVFCTIFLPRILVLAYIYENQKFSTWFWIYSIALIIIWGWNITHFEDNVGKIQKMCGVS